MQSLHGKNVSRSGPRALPSLAPRCVWETRKTFTSLAPVWALQTLEHLDLLEGCCHLRVWKKCQREFSLSFFNFCPPPPCIFLVLAILVSPPLPPLVPEKSQNGFT